MRLSSDFNLSFGFPCVLEKEERHSLLADLSLETLAQG